ncbi:MAG: flagellar brake domain-containing protein [Lachnospiraceae bacterium]|nr:flagellar brake domain-containing protein [Lachnospiraceae bacterium]
MLSKYIIPGERIEMYAVDRKLESNPVSNKKAYVSKVFDILSEDRLEITMPLEKTKLILLPVGEEYDMYFYTKKGLYQCFAKVTDRYKSNNVYILVLELVSNLRKFQRREYYRFGCAIDTRVRALEKEEIDALEKNEEYIIPDIPMQEGIIVDISGGGIRFITDNLYEAGTMVYCKYQLQMTQGLKEYKMTGRILNNREVDNRPGEYEHRLQYVNFKEAEREEIIRYIFEEERKHRQKEKG